MNILLQEIDFLFARFKLMGFECIHIGHLPGELGTGGEIGWKLRDATKH